ncbi:MAG TPA: hypothetical protein P5544_17720 [Candidatus Nanopelagicales bacterium]|nr:hypothetical protein [Candidatus Nanopelagicales bacterium]
MAMRRPARARVFERMRASLVGASAGSLAMPATGRVRAGADSRIVLKPLPAHDP